MRITFAPDAIKEGELRPGLSVVASVRTRDESQPKPTLLGALGLGAAARRERQAVSAVASARDVAALSGAAAAPPRRAAEHFDKRRLVAFIFMVFGMFMAILDIQIVSASLSEIQAGLSASQDEVTWVQTSYLIAEVIMIPLSGFLSRAFSTRYMFVDLRGRLHADELDVLDRDLDRRDDRLARAAGLHRRRHDPDRVRLRLHDLSALASSRSSAPIIGLVATLAPTIGPTVGGYLTDVFSWHWLFLVNIPPGIMVTLAAWLLIDFDKPRSSACSTRFDWTGLIAHGGAFSARWNMRWRRGPRRTGSRASR